MRSHPLDGRGDPMKTTLYYRLSLIWLVILAGGFAVLCSGNGASMTPITVQCRRYKAEA